jgi:hypothetical protein
MYTVKLLVTDNYPADSNVCTYTVRIGDCISPPSVDAGAYSGDEGSAIALSDATATDPDGDSLTYSWTVDAPRGLCDFDDDSLLHPTLTCLDEAEFTATLNVSDGTCPPVSDDAPVTVHNVAPTCKPTSPTWRGAQVDELITFSAVFTDPGVLDTHTAAWDWGDETSSAGTVTQGEGVGSVSDQHSYSAPSAPDVYTVTLTVADKYPSDANECTYTVVIPNPLTHSLYFPIGSKTLYFCRFPKNICLPWVKKVPENPPDPDKIYEEVKVVVCPRDELPESGSFYFSSQPYAGAPITIDDEISVYVGDKLVLGPHDFVSRTPPYPPYLEATTIEIPRKTMEEEMAGQTITIRFRDVYGQVYGCTTPVWLVHIDEVGITSAAGHADIP